MSFFSSPRGRWQLALALITLGACTDDAATTAPSFMPKPRFAAGEVFTVTNASGGTDVGSLRWAIDQATGGETIRFDPGLAGDTIVAGKTVDIFVPLTIEGPKDKGITITSARNGSVFLSSAVTLTLRNMTITGGKAGGSAGGVLTNGDLVLENTTVTRNEAYSTAAISGNTVTLINSTVSGNTSLNGWAAIFAATRLNVVNSTIANNSSGGIQNDATSSLVLRNSVLAGNGTKPNCTSTGVPVYEGRNLSSDWSCGDSTIIIVANAKLDSLSDNGGPSPTHALDRASRAINAGMQCSVTADQRYVTRDPKCDLGAFEFTDFTVITVTFDPSLAVNSSTGYAVLTGTVRCTTDERVDLAFSLEQVQKLRRGQATVRAESAQTMDCGPTPRVFASPMVPTGGGFINTAATAKANASATPVWVAPSETVTPVKLYWSHR